MIALIATAGALALVRLAQRSKITPDELDRTAVNPDEGIVGLAPTAPAHA